MEKEIKLGKYKHFKGDIMEVVGVAKNSENPEEDFVVYKHTSGEKAGEENFWIRPLAMFLENVERDGYKGPRFKYIEE